MYKVIRYKGTLKKGHKGRLTYMLYLFQICFCEPCITDRCVFYMTSFSFQRWEMRLHSWIGNFQSHTKSIFESTPLITRLDYNQRLWFSVEVAEIWQIILPFRFTQLLTAHTQIDMHTSIKHNPLIYHYREWLLEYFSKCKIGPKNMKGWHLPCTLAVQNPCIIFSWKRMKC